MQAIKQLYINLVDLEHEGHLGNAAPVLRFSSEAMLREYSRRTGRRYKKDLVPRRSLLELLQHHLLDSGPEEAENPIDSRKKKGGKQERRVDPAKEKWVV